MSQQDPKQLTPAAAAAEPRGTGEVRDASPFSADAEIQELRTKVEEKEEEARTNYELFLRERAEQENFKKRMRRESADALRFASEPLIRELLPVVDNLERAVEHSEGENPSVAAGVRLVLKALQDVLERHGVTRIDALGAVFDPAQHQAVAHVQSPDHEPNRVVAQHHCGYRLHDRLLRPAMVSVSGRKAGDAVESAGNSG